MGLGGFGEGFGGGVFFEEGWGDEVDADIGALGGEDGGDEEFEGVAVIEGAFGVGVEALEFGDDLGGAGDFLREGFTGHIGFSAVKGLRDIVMRRRELFYTA